MALHAMSPVDAAWYHMDGPANTAVVNALVTTSKPLEMARLRSVLQRRLLRFDRFRQRVVASALGLGSPQWEDVEDLDLDAHLHAAAVPRPGDAVALCRLVGDLASEPLPHDRPLWQAHLIEVGTGSALLLRYHHCIADGMAMMTVAAGLFDTAAKAARGVRAEAGPEAGRQAAPAAEDSVLRAAFEGLAHPSRIVEAGSLALDGVRVLAEELLKPADPASPLKGGFGARQSVAWSTPVDVGDVKAVAWPFNATVNDVLVAAVAGALRSYLAHRGLDLRHRTLRAMVPVNLRPAGHRDRLGNEFGLVILPLPIEEADPVRRVSLAQDRMATLRHSAEPMAMQWLLDLFGRGPKPVQDLAQTWFGSKASLVLTNVAGPRRRLYLAGAPVDRMLFWVPHPGDELGMGLSLLSYRGRVSLGVIADARLVPDPQVIADAFVAELELLARRRLGALGERKALAASSAAGR